ncbi:glycosyltransferase family 4 protein [Pseudooceanicola algae]|uniref:D-inositol-3-phosphate glycosyltransferase n=1 Tax=Pseudooceanicola algae TaxID=1537215 RepID=A0A418SC15_9RHOB|nr:glycosyltransferase family 4 protein [Pseudooceanicola algae]QPM89950.1 D-inositol-3-phosphate glycosyltransferase [Pseudooceanicola algae]
MTRLSITFAIPGDRYQRTGGYIYESRVLDALRDLGHDVEHLELPDGFPNPTPTELAETRALLRAVSPGRILLLDGFLPGCLGPEGLTGIEAPMVPIIHHPLGLETGLDPARARQLLRDEAAGLRLVRRIVVPSPHTGLLLTRDFGIDSALIDMAAPGFDAPEAAPRPISPPLILSVGLLAQRKGHDVLLRALAQLGDLDWQARIVGGVHDPALAKALHGQAQDPALRGRVTFTGLLSDIEVDRAYAEASLFALATRFEGYGIVFGEAMLRGLPIVTCRAGAVPDTVGEAADLVPPDDPEAFAAALRRSLTDPAHRARRAHASRTVGAALPLWQDTARSIAQTLAVAQGDAGGKSV